MKVVLSLFSNFIDTFGRGFREAGYCVVSAGDIDSGQAKLKLPNGVGTLSIIIQYLDEDNED